MSTVANVSSGDFETFTKAKAVAVVDFKAEWCGPCKVLSPIIDELAVEFPDVNFGAVDVDAERSLAEKFNIMSVPSLFFFKNGQVANQMIGLHQKEKLRTLINQLRG